MDREEIKKIVREIVAENRRKYPRPVKTKQELTNDDWDAFYRNRDVYLKELEHHEHREMATYLFELNMKLGD